ncbi:MAG TPA: aminotransferase class I/II-fold pyridoxal phosphate-dependent enzyme [Gemmatimonadaceae bacterium]|nr:aminotransferase class I/II-fold pyridoxal phosphate-dependent enzyme [Gemmatimonadaceae bacterium]
MALDLDLATMRRLGYQVTDLVAEHLASLRDQPAFATRSREEAMRPLDLAPPEDGTEFDAILGELQRDVFPFAAREPHPGFVAYVPSCPTFPAVLGDWIATGYNFFAGVWPVAAGPNALELVVLEWFRRWLGMPEGAGGLLTSGGSQATLTALIAARHRIVEEEPARIARLTVYVSDQAHSSVIRAAWMAGLSRAHVRLIPSDAGFRMDSRELARVIAADRAAGLTPMAVVASAATTNTGAVDPLAAIADVCAREEVWLHIDAAYGGFAILTDYGRRAFAGIERADSVTLDPHKWLFVPFECGGLLAREPARLRDAFHIMPEYLQDVAGHEQINFADYGEQLTRYSRALKVWLSVRYFGVAAIRQAIERGMAVARHFESLARSRANVEVMSPAQFGVVCFRVHPPGVSDPRELDRLNESVLARVVQRGRYFISSTRLRDVYALRICVLGYRTNEADMSGVLEEVDAALAQVSP